MSNAKNLPNDGLGDKKNRWPDAKPWVRRVIEAAGVEVGTGERAEKLMGWWGMEMEQFLGFARGLPLGADLTAGLEGYGRYLNSHEPKLEDWRISQARESGGGDQKIETRGQNLEEAREFLFPARL